ncbi:MAG: cation transporter [Deltaproteobacteria bacterium]|nr:cation transporter [Deltaproteobacteria bacterium]
MRATKIGLLSALSASVCCLGPLALTLLGFGGVGLAAVVGRFHALFIVGGIILLILGWMAYAREGKKCDGAACATGRRRILSRSILIAATTLVTLSAALSLYTALKPVPADFFTGLEEFQQISLPVEGMTCFSCEISVKKTLMSLGGVKKVEASAKDHRVQIIYDDSKVSLEKIIAEIEKLGYSVKH